MFCEGSELFVGRDKRLFSVPVLCWRSYGFKRGATFIYHSHDSPPLKFASQHSCGLIMNLRNSVWFFIYFRAALRAQRSITKHVQIEEKKKQHNTNKTKQNTKFQQFM
jgi:hypothetical protein